MITPSHLLSAEGPFAQKNPHFKPRVQQQKMADAVAYALEQQGLLLVEAGTGVGKTFAYLVPALQYDGHIIITTGTKQLQDQLFNRDLPHVCNTLNIKKKITLLKGRGNYLCILRYKETLARKGYLSRLPWWTDVINLQKWEQESQSGDVSECLPDNSNAWPYVTSTMENCLGSDCEFYNDCFLVKARKKAQESDIIVINHHLLCADIALKEDKCGEILPNAQAIIVDEAHQLPEIAANFLGKTVSTRQLTELAQDILITISRENIQIPQVFNTTRQLEKDIVNFIELCKSLPERGSKEELWQHNSILESYDNLELSLIELQSVLQPEEARNKNWANLLNRCNRQLEAVKLFKQNQEGMVNWYQLYNRNLSLQITPINIKESFLRYTQENACSFTFTSATLAVANSFNHFTDRLGLTKYQSLLLDSPFNYQKQALLYYPAKIPDPQHHQYTEQVIQQVIPVLKITKGRAFILFTSYRALEYAYKLLYNKIEYPLFVQGQAPKANLIQQFCQHGHGILLGTGSFWEGVDVPGSALSCVIIEKLPFASPGDPVVQARINYLKQQGNNAFQEYQLPHAVLTLKQGAGRLIRAISDRGILMICDPRLFNRSYGKTFRASLPNMRYSNKLQDIKDFFKYENSST